MEDPRIISALFIFLKMAYYNVLINTNDCFIPVSITVVDLINYQNTDLLACL